MDQLLANAITKFFKTPGDILYEPACESDQTCNTDQTSFKGFLAEYMAYVTQMAPYTAAQIFPLLATSTVAACSTCIGQWAGMTCSMQWTLGMYDGQVRGVGEQLSIFNVLNANMVKYVLPPLTHNTGGTSSGGPNAGIRVDPVAIAIPPTKGDKAFAGVLTGSCVILLGFGGWFMIS